MLPDGRSIEYGVPVIRMEWYSIENILQKHLTMLLPFYVMRYENVKLEDEELCKRLFEEYGLIQRYLKETYLQKGQEKAFRDVMELINRITNYIFSNTENVRKELGEIMGGRVLELESDRLIKKGEQIGLERGEAAVTNLVKKLVDEDRIDDLKRIASDTEYRRKLMREMQEDIKEE